MPSFARQQLEAWLKTIEVPSGAKVLDVGGSQLSIKGRTKSWDENINYKILDLALPHECKRLPDIIWDLNLKPDFGRQEDWFREQLDTVFCIEVSEYWWNPVQAIENIADFLKPGGLLYISFHFLYPVHNPPDQDFLRYTPAGARKILEGAGFEILEETPRLLRDPENQFRAWDAEKMRRAKEYDKHLWAGSLIKAKKK